MTRRGGARGTAQAPLPLRHLPVKGAGRPRPAQGDGQPFPRDLTTLDWTVDLPDAQYDEIQQRPAPGPRNAHRAAHPAHTPSRPKPTNCRRSGGGGTVGATRTHLRGCDANGADIIETLDDGCLRHGLGSGTTLIPTKVWMLGYKAARTSSTSLVNHPRIRGSRPGGIQLGRRDGRFIHRRQRSTARRATWTSSPPRTSCRRCCPSQPVGRLRRGPAAHGRIRRHRRVPRPYCRPRPASSIADHAAYLDDLRDPVLPVAGATTQRWRSPELPVRRHGADDAQHDANNDMQFTQKQASLPRSRCRRGLRCCTVTIGTSPRPVPLPDARRAPTSTIRSRRRPR